MRFEAIKSGEARDADECGSDAMLRRVRAATARERLPTRQLVRMGYHPELPEIVNNQWKSVWQFWCTYTHSVLGWPGPAQIMSDLVMLQQLAERAVPPGSRAQ